MPKACAVLGAFCLSLACAGAAWGLINPKFTPQHLVQQSEPILVLKVKAADGQGLVQTEIVHCLKGSPPAKPPVLDLAASAFEDQAKALERLLKNLGERTVVLFVGKGQKGRLHVTAAGDPGRWYSFEADKDGLWALDAVDTDMQAVWAGGTDMLIRIAGLLVKHPEMSVPVDAACKWVQADQKIGSVPGKVRGAQAVDLTGDGRLCLYVASEGGDRIFRYESEAKQFRDITAAIKLQAASRAWAWGDFDADGRVDLAAWDGRQLSFWLQAADGTFQANAVANTPAGECLGLHVFGCVGWQRPGLLWSGPAGPVLLVPGERSGLRVKSVFDPAGADLSNLGAPGPCLAADFDGDGLPDVLWPSTKGSLLFKGDLRGGFAKATPCPVALGNDRAAAFLGDYDADGLLDVFVVCGASCSIWQNRGSGQFEETLVQSGEIEHVYCATGICGNTCDFNNDGRQDVLLGYADHAPQLFFNRGFRSFGHAHELDLTEAKRLPVAHQGVQAGLVADLNADAAQDMALVLPGGDVWVILRDWSDTPLGCRVALPLGGGFPGPLSITGWEGNRCLGAWSVTAGSAEAFFGKLNKGPLTLKWRLPGQAEQSKQVIVLKPTRLLLPTNSQ